MKVYVATMQRWEHHEGHNYIIGVFDSLEKAKEAGEIEHEYRGGKYEADITEHEINDFNFEKIEESFKELKEEFEGLTFVIGDEIKISC